jgi:hypothetical protein
MPLLLYPHSLSIFSFPFLAVTSATDSSAVFCPSFVQYGKKKEPGAYFNRPL